MRNHFRLIKYMVEILAGFSGWKSSKSWQDTRSQPVEPFVAKKSCSWNAPCFSVSVESKSGPETVLSLKFIAYYLYETFLW